MGEEAWVTGDQVRVLVGMYVSVALVARPALSVPRSLYDFVSSCPGRLRRLWASAAYESQVMAGILPLIFVDMHAPWSSTVVASGSGYGIVTAEMPTGQVTAIGQWSDRWRFRRLDPSDWRPRTRALEKDRVLTDPATCGHAPHDSRPAVQACREAGVP